MDLYDEISRQRLMDELRAYKQSMWILAQRNGGELVFDRGDVMAAPEDPIFEAEVVQGPNRLLDDKIIWRVVNE